MYINYKQYVSHRVSTSVGCNSWIMLFPFAPDIYTYICMME